MSNSNSESFAIDILNLSKLFGQLKAVDNLSLSVNRGEIIGLLGPNGAGKTTLIHSIMGIYKFTGKITVLGYQIPKHKKEARKQIGFMPQDLAIYLDLTVLQNTLFYGRIYGMNDNEIKNRVIELFSLLDLTEKEDILCRNLSGGQKRRVSLGISLLTNPEILILDEPTVGVDPVLRMEFWNYFKKLKSEGKTILISTHITDEALRTDRVALMINGKLLTIGNPKKLMADNNLDTLEELFIKFKNGGNN